jgi:hypothetical protein
MLDPNLSRYTLNGTFAAFNVNWSIGSGTLPPGVTLDDLGHNTSNQAIAELGGTPTVPGKYSFIVQASTSMGLISLNDTLSVFGLISTSLPDATVGTPYSEQLTTAGGTDPVTFTAPTPAALPPGLTLASDGTITGTPTAGGNFSFNVSIRDAEGGVCVEKVTINVPGTVGNLLLNLVCPVCTVGGPFVILGNTYFGATQAAADALAFAAGNAILAANCVPIGGPTEIGALAWTVAFCCGTTSGSMVGGNGSWHLPSGEGNNDVVMSITWCSPWPQYQATIQFNYGLQPDGSSFYIANGTTVVASGTLDSSGSVSISGPISPGPNSIYIQLVSVNPSDGTITITPLIH